MRRTLTWRLGLILIGVIFTSMIITTITTYQTAYNSLYDAAGIEAYGCASITTGLLEPKDVEDLVNGNRNAEIGKKLNWTVDHKSIFEDQYILSLDGNILALDDRLRKQGFSIGDHFYTDSKAIQMLKQMRHPTYSHIYEFGGMKRLSGYAPIYQDHDPVKEIVAISVIDFNAKIVTERTWNVVKGGIGLGAIPLFLAAIVTLYLVRKKTKPISTLIEQTMRIANGDLTAREIHISSKDEVGDLARGLGQMSTHLRGVISTIKGASEDLALNVKDTSTTMNEMSIALGQVSANMENMAVKIWPSWSVPLLHEEAATSEQIVQLVNRLEAANEAISDSAQEVSAATEESTASIEEVASRSTVVSEMAHRLSAIVNKFEL